MQFARLLGREALFCAMAPLAPIFNLQTLYQVLRYGVRPLTREMRVQIEAQEKKVDEVARNTLKNMIQEKIKRSCFPVQKFQIFITETTGLSNAIIVYDLPDQDQAVGVFEFNSSLLEEAARGAPCSSCQFTVYHEVGHLILHRIKGKQVVILEQILRASIFSSVFMLFGCFSWKNYLLCGVINGLVVRILDSCFSYFRQRAEESIADKFAVINENISVLLGGYFRFLSLSFQNLSCLGSGWTDYFSYDALGNDRRDLNHPPLSQREYVLMQLAYSSVRLKGQLEKLSEIFEQLIKKVSKAGNHFPADLEESLKSEPWYNFRVKINSVYLPS